MTNKIEHYFASAEPETPCLVVDLDRVADNYRRMAALIPWGEIFYAVKANPAAPIIERLAAAGASFDAASPAEIAACVAKGVSSTLISYGNTVKKASDIAFAATAGVDLFAFDSAGELDKIAAHAPGAGVICRIVVSNDGARWPLTRKFGCDPAAALGLLRRAADSGLRPLGLSFHAGSQQTDPARWEEAIALCADIWAQADAEGMPLDLLNLGGGFPIPYDDADVPDLAAVFTRIGRMLTRAFGSRLPRVMVEPGRAIVADAGIIRSEVVLVTERVFDTSERWVYLDIGRYGGLAESEGEAIRYPICAPGLDGAFGPAVVAGPTCDSHDVLYENEQCDLPLALSAGDHVYLHDAGAYTTTYASVGFNGFAPLKEHYI